MLSQFWTEGEVEHVMKTGQLNEQIMLEIVLQLSRIDDHIVELLKERM